MPRSYVITQRTRSHPVLASCLASLERYNWPYEIFRAVQNPSLSQWRDIGVTMLTDRGKMQYRPGAQGCWHSHFTLWQRCLDQGQPIIVLEHDVLVQAPWDSAVEGETQLVKLYKTAKIKTNTLTGQWSAGAHAYYLTPENAEKLITHARHMGAQALDKHLGDLVVDWRFWHEDLVLLNPRRGASTTSPLRRP